jgi:polysaccharide biosynthesis protein PslF
VRFENRYLSNRELVLYLLASDVYVVPYLNLNQIVSGTIAYALGCGRPIVSTASVYAREVLGQGRGVLVEPRRPEAIRAGIASILHNPHRKHAMRRRACALGHSMTWPNVASAYVDTFETAISSRPGNTVRHQDLMVHRPFGQTAAPAGAAREIQAIGGMH